MQGSLTVNTSVALYAWWLLSAPFVLVGGALFVITLVGTNIVQIAYLLGMPVLVVLAVIFLMSQ